MILGQLRIGARSTTYAALGTFRKCTVYLNPFFPSLLEHIQYPGGTSARVGNAVLDAVASFDFKLSLSE